MKTRRCPPDPTTPEAALKKILRKEFERGLGMAEDPRNANLPELAVRVTTIYSPWFSTICRVCRHKFREGDRVRLCPQCAAPYHDDDAHNLHCWQRHFGEGGVCTKGGFDRLSGQVIDACNYRWDGHLPEDMERGDAGRERHSSPTAAFTNSFVEGIETRWRPFGEQRPEKVAAGSPIVGRRCPWCRFDIRAGDWVVACPCGCGSYFHQDIFRHLACWNEWSGLKGKDYCPTTGQALSQESDEVE